MPSNSTLTTIDRQIAKANTELAGLADRQARAQAVIDGLPLLREELNERISYLQKVRARKLAAAPVAAVDGATPVLNTELEEAPDEVVVVAAAEPVVAAHKDPRLTAKV